MQMLLRNRHADFGRFRRISAATENRKGASPIAGNVSLNQNEMCLLLLHATVIARYVQSDRVKIVILQAWVHRWKSYQQGGRTAGVQSVDRDLTEALTEVNSTEIETSCSHFQPKATESTSAIPDPEQYDEDTKKSKTSPGIKERTRAG